MEGARFRKRWGAWLILAFFISLISVGAQGETFSDMPPDFSAISTDSVHYGLFSEKTSTLKAHLLAAEILSINIDIESYKKEIEKTKDEAPQHDILTIEKRICRGS